jgi:hypothetical protein
MHYDVRWDHVGSFSQKDLYKANGLSFYTKLPGYTTYNPNKVDYTLSLYKRHYIPWSDQCEEDPLTASENFGSKDNPINTVANA